MILKKKDISMQMVAIIMIGDFENTHSAIHY
jgi:hypothetical protein